MKQIWMIFLLAGALRSADVTVYQSEYNIVEPAVWLRAMDQAGKIYAGIGVRLHWQGKTADGAAGLPAVVVQYTMRNPSHPGAMAFARPFDPERVVTVMYDRILRATAPIPNARAALLGHVLAHEIGHALMRTNVHSADGIMKAHWGVEDYSRMVFRPLKFMPEEAEIIRRELAAYSAPAPLRVAAAAESDPIEEK